MSLSASARAGGSVLFKDDRSMLIESVASFAKKSSAFVVHVAVERKIASMSKIDDMDTGRYLLQLELF